MFARCSSEHSRPNFLIPLLFKHCSLHMESLSVRLVAFSTASAAMRESLRAFIYTRVYLCVHVRVCSRQLLKTELGSFFTEYLQNQLLTKGMVILRDKIHFYEGTGKIY